MIKQFSNAVAVKVIAGEVRQALTTDKYNKYKPGATIFMCTGTATKKEAFATAQISETEPVEINPENKSVTVQTKSSAERMDVSRFAKDLGYSSDAEFWAEHPEPFKGKVLYWKSITR